MKQKLFYLLIALLASVSSVKVMAQNYTKYLFVYFPSNDNENIYYALSDKNDPFNFVPMNNGQRVISADSIALKRGVRDPHVLRGEDGWFYMVNTDMRCAEGWASNRGIVLMRSRDLVNWQHSTVHFPEKYAGTNFANVTRVWAPETIWDPEARKYLVYFSLLTNDGTIPYDKVFYCYANEDFTDLEGEPQYFYDRGSATIDMDIVYNEKDQLYHGFFKNEGEGGICKVTASRLTPAPGQEPGSQWSKPSGTLQQTHVAVEGAGVWKLIDSDAWILMYDCYGSGYYQFCESTDLTNFTLKAQTNTSGMFTPRHGTVLPVTDEEVKIIEKSFGNDLESRIKQVEGASVEQPIETSFVVNGQMNLGNTGWISTTGARNQGTATNQSGDFNGPFWENWHPTNFTGRMFQNVTNIPNGTYELRISAFVNHLGDKGEQYVYAGNVKKDLITGEPTNYRLVTYVSDNQLEVGLSQTAPVNEWMGIDNVVLVYYGAENLVETVVNLVKDKQYAELVAPLQQEVALAELLSVDVTAAKALLNQNEITKKQIVAEVEHLKLTEFAVVESQYTKDCTAQLGNWIFDNVNPSMSGQHWDGSKNSTYYEQYNGWASDRWQMSMSQQVSLTPGKYVLKVACRSSSAAVDAQVRVGDMVQTFPIKGDAGFGIDLEGRPSFDGSGEYANRNAGRGWEWRLLPFTVTDNVSTEIAVTGKVDGAFNQWMSITSFSLFADPSYETSVQSMPVMASLDGKYYNLAGQIAVFPVGLVVTAGKKLIKR